MRDVEPSISNQATAPEFGRDYLASLTNEQLETLMREANELLAKRRRERQESARNSAWKLLSEAGLDREGKPVQKVKRGRPALAANGDGH